MIKYRTETKTQRRLKQAYFSVLAKQRTTDDDEQRSATIHSN